MLGNGQGMLGNGLVMLGDGADSRNAVATAVGVEEAVEATAAAVRELKGIEAQVGRGAIAKDLAKARELLQGGMCTKSAVKALAVVECAAATTPLNNIDSAKIFIQAQKNIGPSAAGQAGGRQWSMMLMGGKPLPGCLGILLSPTCRRCPRQMQHRAYYHIQASQAIHGGSIACMCAIHS